MLSPEHIKQFVQNTLGCGCPEEVFLSIDVCRNVRVNSFIVLDNAVIIGNRLLVYITEAGSMGCIEEHLPVLVALGKKGRDVKGLNRSGWCWLRMLGLKYGRQRKCSSRNYEVGTRRSTCM